MVDKRPALIARCAGVADVITTTGAQAAGRVVPVEASRRIVVSGRLVLKA
jgi:hypothetical protein